MSSKLVGTMNKRSLLSELNGRQRDIVVTRSGPLLVLAGAGTGKTRVVTYRIAQLISHGTDPTRILAVTFTNRAAAEMRERVRQLVPATRVSQPHISTFHSLCVRILRRHIHHLGLPKRFAIYTRGDHESIARSVLRDIRVTGALLKPSDLLFRISTWKTHGIRPSQASNLASSDREHLAAMAYRRYQMMLKSKGAVDFDDLLLYTQELFEKHPSVRRDEAKRFDHIIIDEYQDTNESQYKIARSLAATHRNLCVVGDDDQSIYAWRGADVKHILGFGGDWPDAKVVRLEDNYRSTEEIIRFANRLIQFNKTRYDKSLQAGRRGGDKPRIMQHPNEESEARQVVDDIRRHLSLPGFAPRDFAILFRTNEQPRVFEAELRKAKLPYTLVGSMSFYDRKEVRDVLAYLKVLDAPDDEMSLLRILNTPARGIGEKTSISLVEQAVARQTSLWGLLSGDHQAISVASQISRSIHDFVRTMQRFRDRIGTQSLSNLARELIEEMDYRTEIRRVYSDQSEQQSRWSTVEELINAIGAFEQSAKSPTLSDFLDSAALMDRDFDTDKEKQLAGNSIALMTFHSAKGLEFPNVYMVGMEEGILPHHRSVKSNDNAIDEERRLCYVGITRAQDRLTLSFCLGRRKWGKIRPTEASRFLFEMTGQADNPHQAERKRLNRQSQGV